MSHRSHHTSKQRQLVLLRHEATILNVLSDPSGNNNKANINNNSDNDEQFDQGEC